jgi:hypothetical protein
MSGWKKLAAASAAAGGGLNIEDIFSVWSYRGNNTTNVVPNGIDLAGEGGAVWGRGRSNAGDPWFYDTERGATKYLYTDRTNAEVTDASFGLNSFNSSGFTMNGSHVYFNRSPRSYLTTTFRKAPKFFDVVTWTGNGQSTQTIPHGLGSAPGFVVIKATGLSQNWWAYHRSEGTGKYLTLNTSNASASGSIVTATSSSDFTVGSTTTSTGYEYVAYVFAHNNNDGGFGPEGDQDVIKCGSYTGTGAEQTISLGFEPEYILIKRATGGTANWYLFNSYSLLYKDESNANFNFVDRDDPEASSGVVQCYLARDGDGFKVAYTDNSVNANGSEYIYMAIRKGPMGEPPSVDKVYTTVYGSDTTNLTTGVYAHDLAMVSRASGTTYETLFPIRTSYRANWSASTQPGQAIFGPSLFNNAQMGDIYTGSYGFTDVIQQVFKRWPGIMDIVHYKGNQTQRTLPHALGVVPEMMIMKCLSANEDWVVYHKDIPENSGNPGIMRLNADGGYSSYTGLTSTTWINDPTDSVYTVGTDSRINKMNQEFFGVLWATLPGFSKIGSYTGDGTNGKVIDMGFTSGARFFVVKRIDSSMNWFSFNSNRSIVAGTDRVKYLNLNSFAEGTGVDWVDPHNSGIIVNHESGSTEINVSGATYIYWALA